MQRVRRSSVRRFHIEGGEVLTAQIKRGNEILWHALTQKPRDEVISEMIKNTLAEREAEQLRMRFGLTGQPPTSLAETSHRLETTDNGVRETEAVALRKLRTILRATHGHLR